jgi:hypothetical protein
MNEDVKNIYNAYQLLCEQQSRPLATLVGASGGGEGGNWGGSLPKLLSILPMGNWKASSLKRSRQSTRSGFMSDHYEGNKIAYAADFGLNSTFGSNTQEATNFAIKVAQRVDPSVTSWEPFKGGSFKKITPDGFRVQIIWLSNVGGNHYDHVHVGVKRVAAGDVKYQTQQDAAQNTDTEQQAAAPEGEKEEMTPISYLKSLAAPLMTDFSKETALGALKNVLGTTMGAIEKSTGKKLPFSTK